MQPPASLKALADPIYEAFYGLTEQPFAITTDPRFFYLSASHQLAFSELLNGMRRREGVQLLTGETGSGKTTLCRAVIQALGPRTFSAMILNPYMSGAEVFRVVLRDFGLVTHEELRRGALAQADIPQLLDTLEGFLRSLLPLGTHAVVVLDEAQSVAPQVLDQMRLLTALEHDNRRLVQIVLCGQPSLLQTLKADALLALGERITRRVVLTPLTTEEVATYIDHRLAIAGGGDVVAFEKSAARLVAELAHGLPRRVNVLCDRALQEGRIEGVHAITPELVKRAARAVAGMHDTTRAVPSGPPAVTETADVDPWTHVTPVTTVWERRRVWLAGIAFAAVVVASGLWYAYEAHRMQTATPVPALPAAPARALGAIPAARAVPTDEEIRTWLATPPAPPERPVSEPALLPPQSG